MEPEAVEAPVLGVAWCLSQEEVKHWVICCDPESYWPPGWPSSIQVDGDMATSEDGGDEGVVDGKKLLEVAGV